MEETSKVQGERIKRRHEFIEAMRDQISGLPDYVLLHILSFLPMEDVIKTSLLSRRWRNIWKSVWNMDFGDPRLRSIKYICKFVSGSVTLHDDSKVQKFHVSFEYMDAPTIDEVDSWIDFAVRHNVMELYLESSTESLGSLGRYAPKYEVPTRLFHCESLTSLTLKHCEMKVSASMWLSSLKMLNLVQLDLTGDMVKDLTSGCPKLEYLAIVDCNIKSALNISIGNVHLKRLRIIDCAYVDKHGTQVEIYAPNLLSLEVQGANLRADYLVKDLSSLVEANIHFEEMLTNAITVLGDFYDNKLKKLLDNLRNVKHLKLCSWCIQALSIREIQRLDIPILNITSLELKIGLTKWEFPGIAHLLRGCCNLETFILSINSKEDNDIFIDRKDMHDLDERGFWGSLELPFFCLLHHLKTVKIHNFLGGYYIRPMENGSLRIEDFLKHHENDIELVKFLLENSWVLERLTIYISKERHFSKGTEKSKLLLKLTQKLQQSPRVSPDTELVFC